jgi:hypothetical protein
MTTSNYNAIKSLLYNYQYGKKTFRSWNNVWHIDWWDGRTSAVKELKAAGLTRQDCAAILNKIINRRKAREDNADTMTRQERAAFIKMVNECTFDMSANSSRYNCTGIDWKAFHRPSSSGGWVLIAPDEPGNNWHTKDPIIVKYLTKKYHPVS